MPGMAAMRNIGAYLQLVTGINPEDTDGTVINGPAIDRMATGVQTGFLSAVLHAAAGAATGSPSAQTVDAKLQESDTSGGTYTDITGAAITQLTADDTGGEVDVDLSGVKRFIRVVVDAGFTAGTTPTIPVSATVALGGALNPA